MVYIGGRLSGYDMDRNDVDKLCGSYILVITESCHGIGDRLVQEVRRSQEDRERKRAISAEVRRRRREKPIEDRRMQDIEGICDC